MMLPDREWVERLSYCENPDDYDLFDVLVPVDSEDEVPANLAEGLDQTTARFIVEACGMHRELLAFAEECANNDDAPPGLIARARELLTEARSFGNGPTKTKWGQS